MIRYPPAISGIINSVRIDISTYEKARHVLSGHLVIVDIFFQQFGEFLSFGKSIVFL